jgi:hypothetical protein
MKTKEKIKRVGKLTIGKMVVIRTVIDFLDYRAGNEKVIYIDERFVGVIDLYQNYKRRGFFLFREPTILEKEFCFWVLDTFNSPVADLVLLPSYIAFKNGDINPDLKSNNP